MKRRRTRPQPPARLGYFVAWIPGHETQADGYGQRFPGAERAAAYRHAAACAAGLIGPDAPTRVAVRDLEAPEAPPRVFSVRLEGRETIATLLEGH